jgi:hypothetical protein
MKMVGLNIVFNENDICLSGVVVQGAWKDTWKKLKNELRKAREETRIENCKTKPFQSMVWRHQDHENAFMWFTKRGIMPEKVVFEVQEQMIETKVRIQETGRQIESTLCRLCGSQKETVQHWLAGCKVLAGNAEYLQRHNNALMVFAVEWSKQESLMDGKNLMVQRIFRERDGIRKSSQASKMKF